jgi:hypothetical protein
MTRTPFVAFSALVVDTAARRRTTKGLRDATAETLAHLLLAEALGAASDLCFLSHDMAASLAAYVMASSLFMFNPLRNGWRGGDFTH